MDYCINHYIKKLESFREDDFTREIILPLFESMGYHRVEFNGGPYERGIDAIATIKNPPHRLPKVIYIQSKKIKKSDRENSRAISDLGHQIRQACEIGFKSALDKSILKPTEIYITTPNIVTQRFHEELYDQFTSVASKPIFIMDGADIIESIKQYCPQLLDKLNTLKDKIANEIITPHGNQDLLNALKSDRKKN
ncbi:restriction endonuclease [Shewanella sp. FJAT-52076]|uniref:restriction endonuclease n=1 Tax=Shewanella sp. FJAT-52076 TaxID=2864202 RepID=UPI001C66212A|nr:restriction endonuclease [Shewanella sp. FJAT-52076]QYJ74869.1 restriction endonuclease [Shewanella sp. FJAT-52076]